MGSYKNLHLKNCSDCSGVPPQLSGIVCAYHPAAPGSSPKQAIYAFSFIVFVFVLYLSCEKNENKQKRGRVWPILKKRIVRIDAGRYKNKIYKSWSKKNCRLIFFHPHLKKVFCGHFVILLLSSFCRMTATYNCHNDQTAQASERTSRHFLLLLLVKLEQILAKMTPEIA